MTYGQCLNNNDFMIFLKSNSDCSLGDRGLLEVVIFWDSEGELKGLIFTS